jgi:hypothetical protein
MPVSAGSPKRAWHAAVQHCNDGAHVPSSWYLNLVVQDGLTQVARVRIAKFGEQLSHLCEIRCQT